ncbi:ATP-dependent DNA helicase [Adhaeribacter aerolatus]|uniref:ATP-dependent DNA helicase n=1 Tax=Adhaeribacter aerolatus TaxID=670289 RepID=A0A512B3T4_9BACT|nr:ATP-binding protein [Adhaeribacter aerolatus]GEO06626.1 ATP-dependent DNA helicase [Adhaeribacter aerolatus]
MMKKFELSELEELIAHGEGDRLEFKKTITHLNKIARTLAAFANTRGGIILVGVLDNGKICGIDPEEEKHSLQKAADFYCDPPVRLFFKEIEHDNELTVLKIIVPESRQKPHLAKSNENDWRGYVRVKDESVQTSKMVLHSLKTEDAVKPSYEPITKQETILLLQFQRQPRITLKQFMHLANISQQRASRILVTLVLHGIIRLHDQEKEPYYTLS